MLVAKSACLWCHTCEIYRCLTDVAYSVIQHTAFKPSPQPLNNLSSLGLQHPDKKIPFAHLMVGASRFPITSHRQGPLPTQRVRQNNRSAIHSSINFNNPCSKACQPMAVHLSNQLLKRHRCVSILICHTFIPRASTNIFCSLLAHVCLSTYWFISSCFYATCGLQLGRSWLLPWRASLLYHFCSLFEVCAIGKISFTDERIL